MGSGGAGIGVRARVGGLHSEATNLEGRVQVGPVSMRPSDPKVSILTHPGGRVQGAQRDMVPGVP